MVKKALMLLGVLAIVGVAGLSLLLPDAVNASEHSATRSIGSESIDAGAELEIEISVSGLGGAGAVRETLPDGFSFVSSSEESASVDGQTVRFIIVGNEATFTYTVTASDTAGTHEFSGTAIDFDKEAVDVSGDSSIEVIGEEVVVPTFGAERSIARSTLNSGEQLTVNIAATEIGVAASIVENIPAGFTYKSSTLSSAAVNVSEDSIRFTLLGGDRLSYILIAGDPGEYSFSGTIENLDNETLDITGDDSVTVNPAGEPSASRSFESAGVAVGGEGSVTVALSNYGAGGRLVETLPEGFTFVLSDLGNGAATADGQNVTFYLLGESSVTYVVSAPDGEEADGVYTFSGVLSDIDKNDVDVAGETDMLVGIVNPTFSDDESGIRQINENTPADVRIGDPIMASAAVGDLTFEITSAAADTFNIENDGQLRTKGPLDYETRQSYSLQVTASDAFGGSASLVVTIQVLDREEYVPPTPVPPTATPVPIPTPTATPVPQPTATPEPVPTNTPTVEPTATPEPEDEGGFPVWAIVIIVIAAVVVVGGGGYLVYRRQS